jgi:hypothetical protein
MFYDAGPWTLFYQTFFSVIYTIMLQAIYYSEIIVNNATFITYNDFTYNINKCYITFMFFIYCYKKTPL